MRSSTRRTLLWEVRLGGCPGAGGAAYAVGADNGGDGDGTAAITTSGPAPRVLGDVGEGCASDGLADAHDLDASRAVARCAAGSPAPEPLAEPAHLRVALIQRGEAVTPVLWPTAWESLRPRGWKSI